jgi:hypothetical protein
LEEDWGKTIGIKISFDASFVEKTIQSVKAETEQLVPFTELKG